MSCVEECPLAAPKTEFSMGAPLKSLLRDLKALPIALSNMKLFQKVL